MFTQTSSVTTEVVATSAGQGAVFGGAAMLVVFLVGAALGIMAYRAGRNDYAADEERWSRVVPSGTDVDPHWPTPEHTTAPDLADFDTPIPFVPTKPARAGFDAGDAEEPDLPDGGLVAAVVGFLDRRLRYASVDDEGAVVDDAGTDCPPPLPTRVPGTVLAASLGHETPTVTSDRYADAAQGS